MFSYSARTSDLGEKQSKHSDVDINLVQEYSHPAKANQKVRKDYIFKADTEFKAETYKKHEMQYDIYLNFCQLSLWQKPHTFL